MQDVARKAVELKESILKQAPDLKMPNQLGNLKRVVEDVSWQSQEKDLNASNAAPAQEHTLPCDAGKVLPWPPRWQSIECNSECTLI